MIDRPIIFSAPMVRGLIREAEQPGRGKTQTRRILKAKPGMTIADCTVDAGGGRWELPVEKLRVPYAIGDRLWVRESIRRRTASFLGIEATNGVENTFYAADDEELVNEHGFNFRPWWSQRQSLPSIHMPRWASRLTLTVTDVRAQRLQEISDEDAWAEGCQRGIPNDAGGFFPDEEPDPSGVGLRGWDSAQDWFADLWEHLHGPEAWATNPWIVALTFTVAQRNIDA